MIEVKEATNVEYAVNAAVNEFKYNILKFLMEYSEKSYSYEDYFIVKKTAMLAVLDGKELEEEEKDGGVDKD